MSLTSKRNMRGGLASAKIKGGYGIPHYYSFYKQRGGTQDRSAFSRITKAANKAMIDILVEGAEQYTLPNKMGTITFRKVKNVAFMTKDGIRSNSPVNWQKTMDLWEKDTRAHKARIKIKYDNMHTGRYSFRIKVFGKKYKNRDFFGVSIKRSTKRNFAKRIKTYNKPKIEAYVK